jgi:hypothetical protein
VQGWVQQHCSSCLDNGAHNMYSMQLQSSASSLGWVPKRQQYCSARQQHNLTSSTTATGTRSCYGWLLFVVDCLTGLLCVAPPASRLPPALRLLRATDTPVLPTLRRCHAAV